MLERKTNNNLQDKLNNWSGLKLFNEKLTLTN